MNGIKMVRAGLLRSMVAVMLAGGLAAPLHAQTAAQTATVAIDVPSIAAYGRLPDFQEMAMSPDGTRIAMLLTVKGQRMIVVKQGDKLLSRLNVTETKVRDLSWAGNNYLLVSTSVTKELYNFNVPQAEFYQTLVIPMDGGEPRVVFDRQKHILSSTFGLYGTRVLNGKPYLFAGGVSMEERGIGRMVEYVYVGGEASLYRIDLTDMSIDFIDRPARGDTRRHWLLDATGNVGATLDMDRRAGEFEIRSADGAVATTGKSQNGYVSLLAFGPAGDTIIYRLTDDDSSGKYMETPLVGGEAKEFMPDIDVDGLYIDPRTNRLIGYYDETVDDKIVLERTYFDPKTNTKVAAVAKAFGGLNVSIRSSSDDYDRIIVRTDGAKDSGSWFDVNLATLRADAVGYERPAIAPVHVGEVRTISYNAADGLRIDALLTMPPGREPRDLPIVILPHGGPTSEDRPGFDWWAQAFASRGYAVLQPNFRGSTNRDAAFLAAGHGEWGRKMQTDLSDGLKHLVAQGIADPERACIMGASYGGYAALAGVTLQQGIYRCAVSVAGVADLSRMVSTDIRESGNDRMIRRNLELQIGKGRDLKDVSPRRFADRADAPVLLIHGKDDIVVPYSQSYAMADALKDAGKPYELVTLEGEDHWLSREETRLQMLHAAMAFMEKHNPPN